MKVNTDKSIALQEKLKSEVRACPQCHMIVENPFMELCPRCNKTLPNIVVDCPGCVHKFLCPIQNNRKFTFQ